MACSKAKGWATSAHVAPPVPAPMLPEDALAVLSIHEELDPGAVEALVGASGADLPGRRRDQARTSSREYHRPCCHSDGAQHCRGLEEGGGTP